MSDVQGPNVRITRARAAKTASTNAVSLENQLPAPFPVGRRKGKKRLSADLSNSSVFAASAGPAKRRAVLGDVTNIYTGGASVQYLSRAKSRKGNDGKGQGTSDNVGNDTQLTEIKEDHILDLHNIDNSASNAVCVDKENIAKNAQEVKGNPKQLTTSAEKYLGNVQYKHIAAKVNAPQIVPSANKVAVASLKQQTHQSVRILRELKSSLDQDKSGVASLQVKAEDLAKCSHSHYIDIDSDHKDPQMCAAYATEIYNNLRIIELKRRASSSYIETVQQEINANMRAILIDWLVEVAEEYKLVPDTLYLTVSYIDRFLSANAVNRQKLQLLGITCMLVASKYEEICAPHVDEFCYITDNTYTRDEVLEMEINVLNYLRYDLTTPTTKSFLRRFVRAAQTSYKVPSLHLEFMGNYLAELSLTEYDFLRFLPSMIAASAIFLARMTLDPVACPWNSTLQHYTGYKISDMRECIQALHDLQLNRKACTMTAIREKYRQHKFKCVASLSPPPVINPQCLKDI